MGRQVVASTKVPGFGHGHTFLTVPVFPRKRALLNLSSIFLTREARSFSPGFSFSMVWPMEPNRWASRAATFLNFQHRWLEQATNSYGLLAWRLLSGPWLESVQWRLAGLSSAGGQGDFQPCLHFTMKANPCKAN